MRADACSGELHTAGEPADAVRGYNITGPPLIEGFSLSLQPGRRVALVGGSGSGKSTVARLICGLLAPWSGSVRIDGARMETLSPARFAEVVAHVDQEV